MPHSVQTFLDQVDMGVWDDGYFGIHAGHVYVAHNSPSFSQRNPGVEVPSLTYPEYSPDYPHDRYTLAFPPSSVTSIGPRRDFYINLRWNNENHSPRVAEDGGYVEGDSCFGRVVDEESRRVVDRMDGMEGGDPVWIKSARIVVGER